MSIALTATRSDRSVSVIRWVFGIYFVAVGILHFIVPEGLPQLMVWMYELSDPLHAIAGTAEILGGLGLVLPHLVGVAQRLTIVSSSGLAVVMIGAVAWHGGRGEWLQILGNLVVAALMTFVAVHEWRRQPR